ncbi:MAG: UvrB/UvrC motif-containing protein [Patescibacteria group bacterium]|nr:UvrB/UvrC motif-containing protein [Patescibacteria group bacterium]
MYWLNFLHIYQPPNQNPEILKKVVNESYRPLFKGLFKIKNVKLNLNINAGLTELLIKSGYFDVINSIYQLAKDSKIEFTESAKYHPLLPFLDKEEIIRQIKTNHQVNKKFFGSTFKPVCFFPPEMAYHPKIGKIVAKLGYQMIILDEIAFPDKLRFSTESLFKLKGENLICLFRERRISNCLMSALVKNRKEFLEVLAKDIKKNIYLCSGVDGETFGHHRPGLEKSFLKIVSLKRPKQIFFSELPKYFKVKREISPRASTWASSQMDIERGTQFYSWKDPENKIHQLQWKFLKYLKSQVKKRKVSKKILEKYDRAISSDQFFWASGEPWWSIEMIEKGAWEILEILKSLVKNKKEFEIAKKYYFAIIFATFKWQREGKIVEKSKKYQEAVRIPFKERTLKVGGFNVYKIIISLMKKKMAEAVKNKNYEKAILWRDGIWKLETKNDIYNAIHIVDLLRIELPEKFKKLDPKLNELFQKYKEKYKEIQSGQPELRKI